MSVYDRRSRRDRNRPRKRVVDLGSFEAHIMAALQEEAEDAEALVEQLLDETAQSLVDRLRRESPRDSGFYASGWEDNPVFRVGRKVHVIRNMAAPQLTHLLEYGRKSDKGVVGRRPHIRLACEAELEELDKRLQEGV